MPGFAGTSPCHVELFFQRAGYVCKQRRNIGEEVGSLLFLPLTKWSLHSRTGLPSHSIDNGNPSSFLLTVIWEAITELHNLCNTYQCWRYQKNSPTINILLASQQYHDILNIFATLNLQLCIFTITLLILQNAHHLT